MPVIQSKLNARSADFQANAKAMRALVDDLTAQVAKVGQGGGEAARKKHLDRGKLLPRVRVQMLLDPGTPFLEIAPLAALHMYPDKNGADEAPAAGLVAGIGVLGGRLAGAGIGLLLIDVVNRQSFHWSMDLHFPWAGLLLFASTMIALAALAAVLAGRQAMRQDAVLAVREDW